MNILFQSGILEPIPAHGRVVEFDAIPGADTREALRSLTTMPLDGRYVVGLGPGLVLGLGQKVPGLRPFPAMTGFGCSIPSTQSDLWCWVRGEDRGEILHNVRSFISKINGDFHLSRSVDLFKYDRGLDLTGYEDGTENPEDNEARAAAIMSGAGPGMDGSSFVAIQQWRHDLARFESFPREDQDHIIGRRLADNEEIGDAPESAHVKRTAQESFSPEAFVVRRSMPWADASGEGLVFIAFGHSLDAYEAQLRRMTGQDDGIVDGLFRFTKPVTGSYFWCPPVGPNGLDLAALGL
ncbi:MAG: Dyp-type peroxidase [Magnetococcales bacterium]|nr:Dyp-type peroxidase [Magnetococcales bacterium]